MRLLIDSIKCRFVNELLQEIVFTTIEEIRRSTDSLGLSKTLAVLGQTSQPLSV
jgi:hypothetical protein